MKHRLNRYVALSSAALVGFLGVQVAGATVASAHTPTASISCTSWSIKGVDFTIDAKPNTYSYSIDGATPITGTFGVLFGPITGTFPVGSGNHTLKGYVYEDGNPKATYSADYNLSTTNCATTSVAVPAAPTPNPPTCTMAGSPAVPTDSADVHWTLNGDVATATAQGNSVFVGGAKTAIFAEAVLPQLDANSAACASHITVVVPVQPAVTQASCNSVTGVDSGFTITPATTTGITYSVNGLVVTATADAGSTLGALPSGWTGNGTSASYTVTRTDPTCVIDVTPVPPIVTPVPPILTGPVPPIVTGPIDVTPVTPIVTEAGCAASGTTTTPPSVLVADTANVTYTVASGPYLAGGTTLVTATAAPGYTFVQGGLPPRWAFIGPVTSASQATYPIVFAAAPLCGVATAPTFTNDVCKSGGATGSTLTLPVSDGVDYWVDGTATAAGTYPATDGSTVTVTAQPQDGYTLVGTHSWTHQFDATPKCVGVKGIVFHHPRTGTPAVAITNEGSTLPFTGAPIGVLVLLGGVMTAAGGAICIGARRRRLSALHI